jgi:hypothetical protein
MLAFLRERPQGLRVLLKGQNGQQTEFIPSSSRSLQLKSNTRNSQLASQPKGDPLSLKTDSTNNPSDEQQFLAKGESKSTDSQDPSGRDLLIDAQLRLLAGLAEQIVQDLRVKKAR